MSSFNLKFCFSLGILLGLRGVLGTPVSTTTAVSYTTGTWDATISPSPSSSTCLSGYPSTTCSRSICVDNINECGQMYGGCFLDPACTGGTVWPTFVKPPCPSQVCSRTICADYINECGGRYGGCFLDPKCTGGTAWPTFSKPPCPTTTPSSSSIGPSTTCSQTICVDKVNSCGQKYGGCALDPKCTGGTGLPSFSAPPCSSSTLITSVVCPTPTPKPVSTTCTRSICADYINECGAWYGGCFLDPKCTGGSAFPTFAKPPCPSTPTAVYATVTSIKTVTYNTTSQPVEVTVTKTYTSTSTKTPTSSPAILVVSNGTYLNATVPTTTSSVPLYTGAAARNFVEFGTVALVVAAGVLLL